MTDPRPGTNHVVTAALAAALSIAALAGCGNSSPTSRAGGDSSSRSATPSPSRTASPTPTPSPTPSRSATPSGGGSTERVCGVGSLDVGLRRPAGGGAAGSVYVLLTFTNTSTRTCSMSGHPGVSFVGDGNGTQLGTSADRVGTVRTVHLAPGKTTTAVLKVAQAGNYAAGKCSPTTADGLRVYPPDSRASVFVAYRTEACSGRLGRGHSQLQVSAVGQSG